MTIVETAKSFSNGRFEEVYGFLAEDAEWNVVGESRVTGNQAIIDNCKKVGEYFKSVTTNFKTCDVIVDQNKVAITGTAEFFRDRKRVSFVSACDIYHFTNNGKIQRITSYCIQAE